MCKNSMFLSPKFDKYLENTLSKWKRENVHRKAPKKSPNYIFELMINACKKFLIQFDGKINYNKNWP
jgi:hypothetical protein